MQIAEIGSEALKKSYRVTIEAADIARAVEVELKSLGKKVKIPGFRPGFVPLKVLKQRYGGSVQGDVLKNVVNDATEKVIRGNQLKIAAAPDVKVEDYKEDGDLVFTLAVDTMPAIPELDMKGVSVEREVFEVSENDIDDALRLLAGHNPRREPLPPGTAAKEGQVVTMDFTGSVGGVPFEGGSAQGFTIEIGSGRLIPGFEDQLVGAKAGDGREVKVTFPENYFNKDLAGKEASFAVKVHEVAKLETPEIDEAFAIARGMKNVAALREAVKEQIKKEYDGVVRTRVKKRLFDTLEPLCDFPLPPAMVEMEFNAIWGRLQQAKNEDADVFEGKSEEEMKAEYRHIAKRRVRLGLLLADIGSREKLQVSKDELTRALVDYAGQFPGQEKAVFDFYRKNPQRLDELRGPILEDKAVDWILERVKLTDRRVTTKELAEAGPEDDVSDASADDSGKKASPKKKAASGTKKKAASSEE